jgi:hypothetical protein
VVLRANRKRRSRTRKQEKKIQKRRLKRQSLKTILRRIDLAVQFGQSTFSVKLSPKEALR